MLNTVLNRGQRIKIICTLGPTSMHDQVLKQMDALGVDLLRLNMSHTSIEELDGAIKAIMEITAVPLCIDTEGAQIRTGRLVAGQVELQRGSEVTLFSRNVDGDERAFTLTPPEALHNFELGTLLSVDFNAVLLMVVGNDSESARARVLSGGTIGSNKAVTSDRTMSLPALTLKDQQAIKIAMKHGIEQYALSFASDEASVLTLRQIVGAKATIISKVETRIALGNLDGIIKVSDAILIDRGDLSRDVPVEHVPFLQKRIITEAHQNSVPVYVATNLLESMVSSPHPSRAEISDITTTLLDGADGLVLAAETAIGRYPVRCVNMVNRLIVQHLSEADPTYGLGTGWRGNGMLSPSNPPHGGKLVDKYEEPVPSTDDLEGCKRLVVDPTAVRETEQLALGTYSPLTGFMGAEDINGVLDHYALSDGTVWTLPIVLQVMSRDITCAVGDDMVLVCSCCNQPFALMNISDVYTFDKESISRRWFGTTDRRHPGVQSITQRGERFLAGEITLLRKHSYSDPEYCLSPAQVRAIFAHYGWEKVVGFHAKSVPNRVHEFMQMEALDRVGGDGLFIHTILGQEERGAGTQEAILDAYEVLINTRYPKDRVMMSGFYGNSPYAGPREAVFAAICKKNYGCTHFVVGKNQTGTSDSCGSLDVATLFGKLGDIGIEPVFFDEVRFDPTEDRYLEVPGRSGTQELLNISSIVMNEYISAGNQPPEWMMRPEVSEVLLRIGSDGGQVFQI